MKPSNTASKIKRWASILTIVCLLLVLTFVFFPSFLENYLNNEVFKLTYQFLLLTVIGGALTFLFTLYLKVRDEGTKQREQEVLQAKEEKSLQRKFYYEILQTYNDIKKIRRFFRARVRKLSVNGNEKQVLLKASKYDELMSELTVLQLKCEFYCDEVRSNPNLFSTEDIDLYSKLKTVEEYLNTIVDEYENCYRNFPNQFLLDDVPFIPLNQLENLKEFIGKYHEAYKFKELKEAAKTVLKTLLKILTAPPK